MIHSLKYKKKKAVQALDLALARKDMLPLTKSFSGIAARIAHADPAKAKRLYILINKLESFQESLPRTSRTLYD